MIWNIKFVYDGILASGALISPAKPTANWFFLRIPQRSNLRRHSSSRKMDDQGNLCAQDIHLSPSISFKVSRKRKASAIVPISLVCEKQWNEAVISNRAPLKDFDFLYSLETYHDKEVAQTATAVLKRHLWYLSEDVVGLNFFDDRIPREKRWRWSID